MTRDYSRGAFADPSMPHLHGPHTLTSHGFRGAPPASASSGTAQACIPTATELAAAVRAALIYADLFEAPLRADEVHRYLPEIPATYTQVHVELTAAWPSQQGLFHLPGREHLVTLHLAREEASRRLWPQALRWARVLWSVPFVELVGLSGSLAVRNAAASHDIDFMLVTQPGHLWTARALAIGVVRLARTRGVELCPNFLVTTRALSLRQRTFFAAHELLQLIPLHGAQTYPRLLAANPWALQHLPNAAPYLTLVTRTGTRPVGLPVVEKWLSGRAGARFERWESARKIHRFQALLSGGDEELAFSEDECKGHFDHYARRTLQEYVDRVRRENGARP